MSDIAGDAHCTRAAVNVGQFDDAHMWIEAVEAGSAADTVDHGSLDAQLVALREVHAFKTGDVATALEAARRRKQTDSKTMLSDSGGAAAERPSGDHMTDWISGLPPDPETEGDYAALSDN
jgi:hypothetical protein